MQLNALSDVISAFHAYTVAHTAKVWLTWAQSWICRVHIVCAGGQGVPARAHTLHFTILHNLARVHDDTPHRGYSPLIWKDPAFFERCTDFGNGEMLCIKPSVCTVLCDQWSSNKQKYRPQSVWPHFTQNGLNDVFFLRSRDRLHVYLLLVALCLIFVSLPFTFRLLPREEKKPRK